MRCWGVADDGAVVEIVVHPALVNVLMQRWPPLGLVRTDAPTMPIDHRLTAGPVSTKGELALPPGDARSWGGWDRIESDLALFASERLAGLVAVHAAVIVRGASALLVPGASGVGKSSLCIAAHDAGAEVLTDEYALVDPSSGLVSGWRRPVRVRRKDGGVDRVDLTVESDPVRVGLVALVNYDRHAGRAWGPISGAEAVLGLLANTVCAQSRPDEALDAALAIAHSAAAVSGTRDEAGRALVDLFDLLGDEPRSG